MRRQYHSRVVDRHTLIWDVHRLVELTRHHPVQQVALSSIAELDECFWFEGDAATCRAVALHTRLIQDTDLHPRSSVCCRPHHGRHAPRLQGAAGQWRQRERGALHAGSAARHIDADVDALSYDEP
jgi:hypothetical protein